MQITEQEIVVNAYVGVEIANVYEIAMLDYGFQLFSFLHVEIVNVMFSIFADILFLN